MISRHSLSLALLLLATVLRAAAADTAAKPINLLFIMTDQ